MSRVLSLLVLILSAHAQGLSNRIFEVFTGRFHCGGQWTDFHFQMSPGTDPFGIADPDEPATAVLNLYVPRSLTRTDAVAYILRGPYDRKTGRVRLEPLRWSGSHPDGLEMVGIEGAFDPPTRTMTARMLSNRCDAVQMVQGGHQLPPLPPGSSALSDFSPPNPHGHPEMSTVPSNVTNGLVPNAATPAFQYWVASWSEPPGVLHRGAPIDESVAQMTESGLGCGGSVRVSWEPGASSGFANDAVSVTERYVIECLGECKGVLYQPNVSANVTHLGLSTPLPTLVIKAVNLGGTGFRWSFLRQNSSGPPPEIYIHRWAPLTSGPLNLTPADAARRRAAPPTCRAPQPANR